MKNIKKCSKRKTIQNVVKENNVYYIGPKFMGSYGFISELKDSEAKYIQGNTRGVVASNAYLLLDKKSRIITKNLYFNGKKNLFFINVDDSDQWTYYFNATDSKILMKYFKTKGKKDYPTMKEDLFTILAEYKLKQIYDRFVHGREVIVNKEKYSFGNYNSFRNHLYGWSGFGGSWTIEISKSKHIRFEEHYMAAYRWNELYKFFD